MDFWDYIGHAAAPTSPTDQIAQAHRLLAAGASSHEEFAAQKSREVI